jgi:uncharacterized protein
MKTAALLTLTILVVGPFAGAQELTKQAKIERLLDAMNADATINQLFDQIKAMTAAQIPPGATPEQTAKAREVQDKILDLVKSRISWEKMRPSYITLYSETFSDEEVSGILAFYQSPPGRAMLAKMPALLTKLIQVAQTQMAELQPDIQRILREAQQR